MPQAHRLARVPIPQEFLSTDEHGRPYGGDIRVGDLTGDGVLDIVVYRSLGGLKPSFLGAFNIEGEPLWSVGDPHLTVDDEDSAGRLHTVSPDRPGPVVVADVDGDGIDEVICLFVEQDIRQSSKWNTSDIELLRIDGATGNVTQRAAPSALRACDGTVDGELLIPNYVHQRLLVSDLDGTGLPSDIVLKLGQTVLAFDAGFDVRWCYTNRWNRYPSHAAYIPAVGDLDGDGCDEVNGGLFLLDHDGRVLWEEFVGDNMDSVLVEPWDTDAPRAFGSAGGLILDASGTRLLELGLEDVPHGQEIRCGRFLPGRERCLAVRFNGHNTDLLVADGAGIHSRFAVDESPNNTGLETIRWFGEEGPDLIYSPASLWNGDGTRAVTFPDLPPPTGGKMGWYHCIPASVTGRDDDVVLYDPWQADLHIYTRHPEARAAGYRTTRRQSNVRLID